MIKQSGQHFHAIRAAVGCSWLLAMSGTACVFVGVYYWYGGQTLPDEALWILVATVMVTSVWILGTMLIAVIAGVARMLGFLSPKP